MISNSRDQCWNSERLQPEANAAGVQMTLFYLLTLLGVQPPGYMYYTL